MLRTLTRCGIVVALGLTIASAAFADATGKWTWTVNFQGNESKQTLDLKQDGEKLTGTTSGRVLGQKTEIKDGTASGNDISFVVVRSRNGQEFKQTFKGTIDGDTLKCKVTFNVNGQEMTRDFTAKREK